MGSKLTQDDRVQVYEAIAFVISAMPMEQAARSLRQFSVDILALVHTTVNKPTASNDELKTTAGEFDVVSVIHHNDYQALPDSLESLEVMLAVIDTFGEELPQACRNSCKEAWTVFDSFIAKYGSDYNVCERVTRVLRLGLNFFGADAKPVIPSVLLRMATAFQATGYASYLWIIGKIIGRFGFEEDVELRTAFKHAFEQVSTKLVTTLQETQPSRIPDGRLYYAVFLVKSLTR